MNADRPELHSWDLASIGRRAAFGVLAGTVAVWALVPFTPPHVVTIPLLLFAVAATSWWAGRIPGTFAAMSTALWFGFALTSPRFEAVITETADVLATLGLLVFGLGVSEAVAAGRRRQVRRD
jgi:K+-sensing histidine kinase KdpD